MSVKSDMGAVNGNVAVFHLIHEVYQPKTLTQSDERSKITANANGKAAFERAQSEVQLFSDAMYKEAENLQSIGFAFERNDNILAVWSGK